MKEHVIGTDDVTALMKKLAVNVIGEVETELMISDSRSTKTVWFTPQEVSSEGFTGGEVFHGLVSLNPSLPVEQRASARIQMESPLLILIADL